MLSIQINTMAMLLSEFDFLPIYRADLAGSRTLSFQRKFWNYFNNLMVNELISYVKNGKTQIKVVKILQELAETEPKAYPKHQRERRTNIS